MCSCRMVVAACLVLCSDQNACQLPFHVGEPQIEFCQNCSQLTPTQSVVPMPCELLPCRRVDCFRCAVRVRCFCVDVPECDAASFSESTDAEDASESGSMDAYSDETAAPDCPVQFVCAEYKKPMKEPARVCTDSHDDSYFYTEGVACALQGRFTGWCDICRQSRPVTVSKGPGPNTHHVSFSFRRTIMLYAALCVLAMATNNTSPPVGQPSANASDTYF